MLTKTLNFSVLKSITFTRNKSGKMFILGVCPTDKVLSPIFSLLTISYHLYFLRISKVCNMLHHGSVGRAQNKQCRSVLTYSFLAFLFCFSSKNCALIVFVSFFDETPNLRNKILAKQKPELVIRNCQWNCILVLNFQGVTEKFCQDDVLKELGKNIIWSLSRQRPLSVSVQLGSKGRSKSLKRVQGESPGSYSYLKVLKA